MAVVQYFGNGIAEGLVDGDSLEDYTHNDSTVYLENLLRDTLKVFIEEGYAVEHPEKPMTIVSDSNGKEAGFYIEYDKETKDIKGVGLLSDGFLSEYLDVKEALEVGNQKDVIFEICGTIGVR